MVSDLPENDASDVPVSDPQLLFLAYRGPGSNPCQICHRTVVRGTKPEIMIVQQRLEYAGTISMEDTVGMVARELPPRAHTKLSKGAVRQIIQLRFSPFGATIY
jgi:hypothetical protein